jgi:hypothetical protein
MSTHVVGIRVIEVLVGISEVLRRPINARRENLVATSRVGRPLTLSRLLGHRLNPGFDVRAGFGDCRLVVCLRNLGRWRSELGESSRGVLGFFARLGRWRRELGERVRGMTALGRSNLVVACGWFDAYRLVDRLVIPLEGPQVGKIEPVLRRSGPG